MSLAFRDDELRCTIRNWNIPIHITSTVPSHAPLLSRARDGKIHTGKQKSQMIFFRSPKSLYCKCSTSFQTSKNIPQARNEATFRIWGPPGAHITKTHLSNIFYNVN